MTAIEVLRAAAQLNRAAAGAMKPGVGVALAELFELAATDLEMCERQNSQDPDNSFKTRVLPLPMTGKLIALAHAVIA